MWLQGQQTGWVAVAPDQYDAPGPRRTAVVGDRGGHAVDGERGLCSRGGAARASAGRPAGTACRAPPREQMSTAARGELLPAGATGADGSAMRRARACTGPGDPGTLAK